ncbi:MAG: hypothetical protein GKS05_02215 [Nitrospirales bacterium]|nr:hypothetical protein [Nitrospirales bacterium]
MPLSLRLATVIVVFISACTMVPTVGTPVFETPQGVVWLESFADSTRRVSHPQTISVMLIEKFLRGLSIQEQPDPLTAPLAGQPSRTPLFSEQAVTFLTPSLVKALALATAEEAIHFTVLREQGNKSTSISGALVVLDSSLAFVLSSYQMTQDSRSSLSRPNRSFSRSPRWTLWFDSVYVVPNDANFFHEQLDIHPDHALTIEMTRLADQAPALTRGGGTEESSASSSKTRQTTKQELQILRDKIQQIQESLEQ